MNAGSVFFCAYGGMLFVLLIAVLLYVLKAVAIYDLSAGKRNRWFAFVPIMKSYAAGRAAGSTALGKVAAFFSAVKTVEFAVTLGAFGATFADIVQKADRLLTNGKTVPDNIFDPLQNLLLPLVFAFVLALLNRLLTLVCTCRILRKTSPQMALFDTVISFFLPFLEPLFLFGARRKGENAQ
ncbi:MAG: hypothetical protein MJ132_01165 [Clostridia bacterium]|nr:hypothetical protein [Clostridia bacterium]